YAAARRELAKRSIRRGGQAMAPVIVGIDMEALRRHARGEGRVARRVLGKPVADEKEAARLALRGLMAQRERRAARALQRLGLEKHPAILRFLHVNAICHANATGCGVYSACLSRIWRFSRFRVAKI